MKRAVRAFGLLVALALLSSCKSSGANPLDAAMPADASVPMPSDLASVPDLGSSDGGVVGVTSDIVGKITVGYQGWFNAPNDGAGGLSMAGVEAMTMYPYAVLSGDFDGDGRLDLAAAAGDEGVSMGLLLSAPCDPNF